MNVLDAWYDKSEDKWRILTFLSTERKPGDGIMSGILANDYPAEHPWHERGDRKPNSKLSEDGLSDGIGVLIGHTPKSVDRVFAVFDSGYRPAA